MVSLLFDFTHHYYRRVLFVLRVEVNVVFKSVIVVHVRSSWVPSVRARRRACFHAFCAISSTSFAILEEHVQRVKFQFCNISTSVFQNLKK